MLAQLDQWLLDREADRWVVVTGGPGMGKSALLAAWLSRREAAGATVPHHFIRRQQYDWDDPTTLVTSLIAQLKRRFPVLREADDDTQTHPAARLAMILELVSARELVPKRDRLVVLIDGLDEFDPPTEAPGADPLAAFLPSTLPRGVSFLCASRPRHPHLDRLAARDGELKQIDLDNDSFASNNEETVRAFWEREAPLLGLDAEFINEAVERAHGNLQHAATLRKHLTGLPEDRRRVEIIPRGLTLLLASSWERIATNPAVVTGLGILCAAREALTLDELGSVAGWTSEAQRRTFLRGAREFLIETRRADDVREYQLHHDSIRAHVAAEIGAAAMRDHHRALAAMLATWPAPKEEMARSYTLRHALAHRVEADEWADAWRLAANMSFLEAKCCELGAPEAEADVARTAERCRTSGDAVMREQFSERFNDLARVLGRESHWLREVPKETTPLVWNGLRRSGWSAEVIDQQLHLPPGVRFLRLRHLATRESPELARDLVGHTDRVTSCALTPNGRHAISTSWDHTLKIWDLHSGRSLTTLHGHTARVTTCALAPDGSRVVSASFDHTLKVWDLHSGHLLTTLHGHTARVTACAITPDGSRVVSASADRTLKVWDLRSGNLLNTLQGHTAPVTTFVITSDGRRVTSASFDQTLKTWDLHSGDLLISFRGHTWLAACALADDDLVLAPANHALAVWNLHSGIPLVSFEGHTGSVTACAATSDGHRAISASEDHTLKIWDLRSGAPLTALRGHTDSVTACTMSPDGRRVVSASADRTLKVWDLSGRHPPPGEGHSHWVTACAITPDGHRAVSASADHTLKVWDLNSATSLASLQGHTGPVNACTLTPDGRVVSASADHTLKVWDLRSTSTPLSSLQGHTGSVTACVATHDGRVISASHDQTLKVWDLHSKRLLASLEGHSDAVTACAVTRDGRRVISASYDHTLKVWDLHSKRLLASLEGHSDAVTACAVTHDGRHVVSASYDQTLKVWGLERSACLLTHRANSAFRSVATTDSLIVAGNAAGAVCFLDWPSELHTTISVPFIGSSPDAPRSIISSSPIIADSSTRESPSSPRDASIDVFIAHSGVPADAAFVNSELVPALELVPGRIRISSEVPFGQSGLRDAFASGRAMILVLSPPFLRDAWPSFREDMRKHITSSRGVLVPLLLENCELPLLLTQLVLLDCRNPAKRPAALRRLLATMTSPRAAPPQNPG